MVGEALPGRLCCDGDAATGMGCVRGFVCRKDPKEEGRTMTVFDEDLVYGLSWAAIALIVASSFIVLGFAWVVA